MCRRSFMAPAPAPPAVSWLTANHLTLPASPPNGRLARALPTSPATGWAKARRVADFGSLPVLLGLKSRFGLTSGGLRRHALTLGADAGVKPNDPSLPLSALSGGNAQKAVLAKWLQTKPRLLLLDEPTQGVDVGARQTIWAALGAASDGGSTILIASTDYEQLAAICHRVLSFAGGRVVAELTGGALTKDAIAEAAFGANRRAA